MDFFELETIPGKLSSKKCCRKIQEISNSILKNQSSASINNINASTLRMLINLFLEYNKKMKEYDNADRRGIT